MAPNPRPMKIVPSARARQAVGVWAMGDSGGAGKLAGSYGSGSRRVNSGRGGLRRGPRTPRGAAGNNDGQDMDLRETLTARMKDAMREKDARRLGTLRLILAALKDQDIALRPEGRTVGDAEATATMAKMVRQRQESARAYEEAGRLELAQAETEEIAIIEAFLPRKLSDDEVTAAVDAAVAESKASSVRDMGRVMGLLKGRYTGRIDFGAVGPMVKERLNRG